MAGVTLEQQEGQQPIDGQKPVDGQPPVEGQPPAAGLDGEKFELPRIAETPSEIYKDGLKAFNKKQWKEAAAKFQELTEKYKDWNQPGPTVEQSKSTTRASYYLGIAMLRQGDFANAAIHLKAYTDDAKNTYHQGVAFKQYGDALINLAQEPNAADSTAKYGEALAAYTTASKTTGIAEKVKFESLLGMADCNAELAGISERAGNSEQSATYAAAAEKLYDEVIAVKNDSQDKAQKQKPFVANKRMLAIAARIAANAKAAGAEADATERQKLVAAITADLTLVTTIAEATGRDDAKKFAAGQYSVVTNEGYKAETAGRTANSEELYKLGGTASAADLAWANYKRGNYADAAKMFGEQLPGAKDMLAKAIEELEKKPDDDELKRKVEEAQEAADPLKKAYAHCQLELAKQKFKAGEYKEADTLFNSSMSASDSYKADCLHGLMLSGLNQKNWDQVITNATAILASNDYKAVPIAKDGKTTYGDHAAIDLIRAHTAKGQIKEAWEAAKAYETALKAADQDLTPVKQLQAEIYVTRGRQLVMAVTQAAMTEQAEIMAAARETFEDATSEKLYPNSEISLTAQLELAKTYGTTAPEELRDPEKYNDLLEEVVSKAAKYIELRTEQSGDSAGFTALKTQAENLLKTK